MQVLTTDSAMELGAKQGGNPVGTGLVNLEVIDLLEKVAALWDEKLAFQLFRSLLYLHRQHPERDGFTTLEIAEALSHIAGRKWTQDLTETEIVSKKIRKYWNDLQELWPTKQLGIEERLATSGLGGQVTPHKHESTGGAGRTSRYAILYRTECSDVAEPRSSAAELANGEIQYFTDDLIAPRWWFRLFYEGYKLSGWRRLVFALHVIAHGFAALAVIALLWAQLFWTVFGDSPRLMLGTVVVILLIAISAWPTFNLIERRIIMAPIWLQSDENDLVLEHRRQPRYTHRHLQAVRYTATCALCGGRVRIRSGGFRFWGRLVGVCDESPREHIFSFDHVLRRGAHLEK